MILEKENKTFEQALPELVKTDLGKFVLIKDDEVVGIFVAIVDALKSGYDRFKNEPFFVRQILSTQQPLNFANNYLFN